MTYEEFQAQVLAHIGDEPTTFSQDSKGYYCNDRDNEDEHHYRFIIRTRRWVYSTAYDEGVGPTLQLAVRASRR